MMTILLTPGGLPTFITYTLLTGDTEPIQNYLEILSRQSDGWTRRMVNEYREAVDTLRAVSSGSVGGDPDDIERAINNLGKFMRDEWELFKEALKDGCCGRHKTWRHYNRHWDGYWKPIGL